MESGDVKIFVKSGDVYSLRIPVSDEDLGDADTYKEYGIDAEFKFYVKLPNPAISSNATTVSDDKLTYTWDLLQTKNIELDFTMEKSFPVVPVIIGVIACLVIVGLIVCKAKKGKAE